MTSAIASPYLVTLGFDPQTFERLDRLRTRFFPPDRNIVPAHLSLIHHLPDDELEAIDWTLDRVATASPPIAMTFPGVKRIGNGVMSVVESPGLVSIRSELARSFSRWLIPQDRQPFRPHVTLMNKADRTEAGRAFEDLRDSWEPWSGSGERLLLWRYRGGPWEAIDRYDFLGSPALLDPIP